MARNGDTPRKKERLARKYGRILGPDEQPADLGKTRRHAHGVSN